jgi:hypothetical protein
MNLSPDERSSHPAPVRRTDQSGTYPCGREERNAAPARSALWPASCRSLRALGVSSQRFTEAKTGETRCAGCTHSAGSDENSGNASCEACCRPRPDAVESAEEASPAAPRGPKIRPLPASAGLAAAGAGGATEGVAFPDPPSDAPDPGKTRKAASPNDPGKGRTGKSATPMDSPNDPGKGRIGKSVTIRNAVRRGSSGRAGVRTLFGTIRSVLPPIPALEPMAQMKTNPPCRKSLASPTVATRAPENRKGRTNPRPCQESHMPRARTRGKPTAVNYGVTSDGWTM